MKSWAGRDALIVGCGPDVEQEAALARRHMPDAVVIGVNYGAAVIEPDILFSNHARVLPGIARRIERTKGWRPALHTTPLAQDRNFTEGMTCWPEAYRIRIGSGMCAAVMAKLMGCDRAVLAGCPHGGAGYWSGRRNVCADEHRNTGEEWSDDTSIPRHKALDRIVPELKGFVTSTSGRTRMLLGQPWFMTGTEPWLRESA